MQDSALSTIALPVALAIVMLGLGLHLRLDDFKRILLQPKAIALGLLFAYACLTSNPRMPEAPKKPYDTPLNTCRRPYVEPTPPSPTP